MYVISHNVLMLIILLLILLIGTIKQSFKKTLIVMLLLFIIDSLIGYPIQTAFNFKLFNVLLSPLENFNIFEIIGNWITNLFNNIL